MNLLYIDGEIKKKKNTSSCNSIYQLYQATVLKSDSMFSVRNEKKIFFLIVGVLHTCENILLLYYIIQ